MRSLRTTLLAVALVTRCSGFEPAPPPDSEAPATNFEIQRLGPDAYDQEFLLRWRKCTQYASDSYCYRQFYGGDRVSF
jgi:hypothetical protein